MTVDARTHASSCCYRLDRLVRADEPATVCAAVSGRLLGIVATLEPDARLTLTMSARRLGAVTILLHASGVGPGFGDDLAWCGRGVHVWAKKPDPPQIPRPAHLHEIVAATEERERWPVRADAALGPVPDKIDVYAVAAEFVPASFDATSYSALDFLDQLKDGAPLPPTRIITRDGRIKPPLVADRLLTPKARP